MTTVRSTFNFGMETLSFDAAGNLYAGAGTIESSLIKMTPAGVAYYLAADQSSIDSGRANPDGWVDAGVIPLDILIGMATLPDGTIFFTEYYIDQNGPESIDQIFQIDTSGLVSVLAGSGTKGGADGPAALAQFNSPTWLAVDSAGDVLVADLNGLRRIVASGTVTTVASGVSFEWGMAVDTSGNVYASLSPNTIQKITPTGQVVTIAGDGDAGYRDGSAATAEFDGLSHVAVNSVGDVYVANGFRVRKVDTLGQVTTIAGDGQPCDTDGNGGSDGTAEVGAGAMAFSPNGDLYVAAGQAAGTGGPLMKIHFNP
ncbi:MAG: NHL repeat-containing protein [Myxococcales bacterium]